MTLMILLQKKEVTVATAISPPSSAAAAPPHTRDESIAVWYEQNTGVQQYPPFVSLHEKESVYPLTPFKWWFISRTST